MRLGNIKAREILDSRGNPTVEVEIKTSKGVVFGVAPSGASTGKHEALELRDGKDAYLGLGVSKAVANVSKMALKLKGKQLDLSKVDAIMIKAAGKNKAKMGANATTALSMAAARALALDKKEALYKYISKISNRKVRMPVPFANVINGGKHASGGVDIQEFMLVPVGAKSFREATRMLSETYHVLKQDIIDTLGKESANVADEGGFVPKLRGSYEALRLLDRAIIDAGYKGKMKIAIDAAADSFYNKGKYNLDGYEFYGLGLVDRYIDMMNSFPIVSLEDPFAEDDPRNFQMLMEKVDENKTQIVGDDLLVTNPDRIKKAIEQKLCNSLLLKVNQIGTVSETIKAAKLAFDAKWNVMVSHRSGETEDSFIADLAVGLGCGQIKLGAPCRGERTVKYNRLLRIEEELGNKASYGWK